MILCHGETLVTCAHCWRFWSHFDLRVKRFGCAEGACFKSLHKRIQVTCVWQNGKCNSKKKGKLWQERCVEKTSQEERNSESCIWLPVSVYPVYPYFYRCYLSTDVLGQGACIEDLKPDALRDFEASMPRRLRATSEATSSVSNNSDFGNFETTPFQETSASSAMSQLAELRALAAKPPSSKTLVPLSLPANPPQALDHQLFQKLRESWML